MKINRRYKLAKEWVMLSGIAELILGVYIGFKFGEGNMTSALFWLVILAVLSYVSSRIWIWCLEVMVGKDKRNEH